MILETQNLPEFDARLHDEEGRLAALRRYEILDTQREAPFEKITALVQAVLNVPIATVSLIDADRQWYKSCAGMDSADLPRELSFCTHTIQSREPLLIPDTLADPRFSSFPTVVGPPFVRSYAGIPLSTPDGYNLGALCALDTEPREFTAGQIEVLKSFAALVVDELELRRIAERDSLTEAATRRSFIVAMEQSMAKSRQAGGPVCVCVMDIDHFKRVNDNHGHAAGDTVLRDISRTLFTILRGGDLLGRLGGEEFGILLTTVDLQSALKIADRLRQAIEVTSFPGHPGIHVTASFGVAALESRDTTPAQWLARADAAVYAAKRNGRNRVCVDQEMAKLESVA